MKGVGSNVKGTYHELLFTNNYNDTHDSTYAEMFAETNHPGADIQIKYVHTHEVVGEYQLKAVAGTESIHTHFYKYPDIQVYATDEVAKKISDTRVQASGYENEVLKDRVHDNLDSVADNSMSDRAWDSFLIAAGVASTRELFEMVNALADSKFSMKWVQLLSQEIMRLRTQSERLGLKDIRSKLIHLIETEGKQGVLKFQSDFKSIASEIGVTHEALYRAIAILEKEGFLEKHPNSLELLKKK